MTTELITGNTYPVREHMRRLGGQWQARLQGWAVPTANAAEARRIVEAAGPAPERPAYTPRRRSRYGNRTTSSYTRFSSGAEVYTNRNGRCEDAPCCGCCT